MRTEYLKTDLNELENYLLIEHTPAHFLCVNTKPNSTNRVIDEFLHVENAVAI